MSKTILITGVAGFIGSHFVEHVLRKTDWNIIGIDKLSYASKGFSRLRENGSLTNPRMRMFTWDLVTPLSEGMIREIGPVNYILHFAAETHVDRSCSAPVPFIQNNINSTLTMLEYARTIPALEKFVYFSSDESFGTAKPGEYFSETAPHNPSNPYSASKSASEMICLSYANTYRLPIIVTHLVNIFGERQLAEKMIPKCIKTILAGETMDIHSYPDGTQPGSRFYLHGRNAASATLFLIKNGVPGEIYNISSKSELNNLELAQAIADIMGKPLKYRLVSFHADRPYHDLRYSLDGSKLEKLGWSSPVSFSESLRHTVLWTLENPHWLDE
jgi:dTDP-glucose 4,6-dehydratase